MQFSGRAHPYKKNVMRDYFYKGLLFVLLGLFAGTVRAQMPSIKTDGTESGEVYLQKLDVQVVVSGAFATTSWTMTFKNSTRRILEGTLNFPLPQGVPVSKYALDINGVMREAVPVEKEKATLVFENTERRQADPGLLEKVDGNTFSTRIYPINPGGVRTVRISYEQELSREGAAGLRYRLPLAFTHPLEQFNLRISVPGGVQRPSVDENPDDALRFEEWKETWLVSKQWTNYLADKSVSIHIPQTPGAGVVLMQQVGNHYFYAASIFPRQERLEKPQPHHLVLLWDASLSGLRRDRKKEFDLLARYLAKLGEAEVDLVPFSNTTGEVHRFSIRGGDWQALQRALEEIVYDGGTQFGALNLAKYACDEFLLFSDGHSSFGSDRIQLGDRPVYAVAAAADADYPFLQSLTGRTGGELLNLNELPVEKAVERMRYQFLQFLGVRSAEGLEESYPSVPTTLAGGLTVTGICYKPVQEIVLQFGYGKKVVREEKIALDYARQQDSEINVSRLWAEKKIAELDTRYEDNKDEIRHLGRSYGIVTRNTSLLVLENIMDYVTYEIEPPAGLREEYDRILKGREQQGIVQRRTVAYNAEDYFNQLLGWWRSGAVVSAERPSTVEPGRASATIGNFAGYMDTVVVTGYPAMQKRDLQYSAESSDKDLLRNSGGQAPVPAEGHFTVLKADVDTKYLDELRAAAPARRYAVYLQLRKDYLNIPLFYFHTAELFLGAGEKAAGLRILSNIAELDAESYELYKLMGYKLEESGEAEAACATFRKVLEWRPFEPQSYRDYGLALEDAGHYQQALDTLYLALTKNYDASTEALYPGIEETILPEINELIALHGAGLDISKVPKKLLTNMPVDMRVVLNWNQSNTDIDLWVTDPDNERCFYGHRNTAMGGRISHDFTRGLGPEQFMLKKAVKGRYKVEVNYYGDTQVKLAGETTVLIAVYTGYGTPAQQRSLVTLQMKPGSKGAVYVGEFNF